MRRTTISTWDLTKDILVNLMYSGEEWDEFLLRLALGYEPRNPPMSRSCTYDELIEANIRNHGHDVRLDKDKYDYEFDLGDEAMVGSRTETQLNEVTN